MVQLTLADISKHLTEVVVDKAFKLKTNSEDSVKYVKVSRAAPAGEGLISAVYRIHVSGNKYTAAFIVKGLVSDPLLRKSLDCQKYFKREAYFFANILPLLIEVQQSTGAKETIRNKVPICYGFHLDGFNDYILMEDLSERKYISISEHPTEHQRDLILRTLAHLHAVSLAVRLKRPDDFVRVANEIPEIYYNETNRKWYTQYLQNAIAIDREVITEYEDSSNIYYKKFDELTKDDLYGKIIGLLTTLGDHPVFNHGDAWSPNFLCSKEQAVAIDFQLFRCASPATDLAYFILLCSNNCCTKEDFMKAVGLYHSSLQYYLEDMSIDANDVFSRENLIDELKKFGSFGLITALTSIPLLASERCDVLDSFEEKYTGLEKIPLEDLWQLTPFKTEDQKVRLINALHMAVDVGLI